MKKLYFMIGIALMVATMFSACRTKENEKGILINDVYWATCDVDMPGTLTENPEDEGMCYQWGTQDPIDPDNENVWNEQYETTEWTRPDDPCPAGWRIPTMWEMASLLDTEKVTWEWTTQNGAPGMRFTDIKNDNSIFLLAAGYYCVYRDFGLPLHKGIEGVYWSSIRVNDDMAYYMAFSAGGAMLSSDINDTNFAFRIRCVRE